jgi:hypothetical protein
LNISEILPFPLVCLDVDDEYEDEDPWEEGAEDILEKGEVTHVALFEDI